MNMPVRCVCLLDSIIGYKMGRLRGGGFGVEPAKSTEKRERLKVDALIVIGYDDM